MATYVRLTSLGASLGRSGAPGVWTHPSRWYPAVTPGPQQPAPTDVDASGREAGESPAQSRYGDRPSGRKSGRRPAVPLEPSRERSGVPCDPPPDPSLRIRSRGRLIPSPYLEPPVDARNAGRRRPPRPILPFTAILAVL